MILTEWQRRLVAGAAFFFISWIHAHSFGFKNTPELMLIYHGSAVAADLAIIYIAGHALTGRVSFDIMYINLCSIVVNFMGFIAYMAYLPPSFYNTMMAGVIYAQWARLIWNDDVANFLRFHVLPGSNSRSNQIHT